MHDWGDEECIDILRKCKEAIPQDTGKVIIVDAVVGQEDHEFKDVVLMLDMVMMAHTSKGKERTLKEWSYVFTEAGFTRYTVKRKPINPLLNFILESQPTVCYCNNLKFSNLAFEFSE